MEKNLQKAFVKHQNELLDSWFGQLINSYPPESVKFFERHKDSFNNPVGSNIFVALKNVLAELIGECEYEKLYHELEMIMRIRAVQDMKPSKAVSFVLAFKDVVNKTLANELKSGEVTALELEDFYEQLDSLALMGFDIYTESRELIYQMRIKQIKDTNDLLQKANLLNESVDISTFMKCSNYMDMDNIQKQDKEGE